MTEPKRPLFQDIAEGKPFKKITPKNRQDASDWFRKKALEVNRVDINKFYSKEPQRHEANITARSIGKMYTFFYDAKHKDDLPYWDKFPLIFPVEFYADRFLGINFHYLSPFFRAKLMDALYTLINNKKYDYTTKLKISYEILKAASQFAYFRPCLKMYLKTHVKSQFMYISPEEWDMALMLPTERFQKKNKEFVWEESRKMVEKAANKRSQRQNAP